MTGKENTRGLRPKTIEWKHSDVINATVADTPGGYCLV